LSAEELQSIRDGLAAGRKPKVQFTESAGQIAGQVGQVVGLADPAVSEEWVVVRFGRDELPFSPADLSVPARGVGRREAKLAAAVVEAPEPEPEFMITRAPVPAPREEAKVTAVEPAASPAAEAKPARRVARAARPKAPAGLTVTLTYADGEWTVAATQGTKSLAKPYVIKPVEALKMVGMVDVSGVHEAVEQIMAAERSEAEQQAQRLRAELAEIEARLAELRDAG
jgi:hypothetical protein